MRSCFHFALEVLTVPVDARELRRHADGISSAAAPAGRPGRPRRCVCKIRARFPPDGRSACLSVEESFAAPDKAQLRGREKMAQFLDIRIAQHGTSNYRPVRIPNPTRIQHLQQCYEEQARSAELRAVIRLPPIDSAGAPNDALALLHRSLIAFRISIFVPPQIVSLYHAV